MSRGPGWIQTTVLDRLEQAADAVSLENLRWELWPEAETGRLSADGRLPSTWNTSLLRAVKGLEKAKRIRVRRRRLKSFDECVAHYPGKSLRADVRKLRVDLLPVLRAWVQNQGVRARYTVAENELFHLRSLSQLKQDELQERWLDLSPTLVAGLQTVAGDDQNALFLVIAKGKSLFETAEVESRRSFGELANDCVARHAVSKDVEEQLGVFSHHLLGPLRGGFLELSSLVHAFAHVPSRKRCSLKKETVEHLNEQCPDVLNKLPGYAAAEPISRHMMSFTRDVRQSELLDHLIDHSVFQRFHFLELAQVESAVPILQAAS